MKSIRILCVKIHIFSINTYKKEEEHQRKEKTTQLRLVAKHGLSQQLLHEEQQLLLEEQQLFNYVFQLLSSAAQIDSSLNLCIRKLLSGLPNIFAGLSSIIDLLFFLMRNVSTMNDSKFTIVVRQTLTTFWLLSSITWSSR